MSEFGIIKINNFAAVLSDFACDFGKTEAWFRSFRGVICCKVDLLLDDNVLVLGLDHHAILTSIIGTVQVETSDNRLAKLTNREGGNRTSA
jgi:hypothetical protein